ncbi:hypothetical protein [Pedobacter sp. JY14-1]|uniref:hypothetical protein n=1 Tax=Pedobacter sp. JY14-1 TaxID=3034151 RepID=UPI0023E2D224|nr:hypothetical protein [Pedobacter sp. JY14-1]
MQPFQPVNPILQLIRRILIWGTVEALFLRFFLNVPWVLVMIFVTGFVMVQVARHFWKARRLAS